MSDIVERLEAHMGLADVADVLPDCREAAAEITRLRAFITALEDGNMTFLCDELDKAKAENARLRDRDEEVREELADAWPEVREATLAGDPAALIAKLIRERDEEIAEHEACREQAARLRSLVEETMGVLHLAIGHIEIYDAGPEHVRDAIRLAARSLLDKMKEG